MNIRQIKKNVTKRTLKFDKEMYTTLLGSFIISLKMLGNTKEPVSALNKFYKKEKREWLLGRVNETTWMEDLAEKLKTEIPYGHIAFVSSKFNCLIAPYVDGQIFPIREDGIPTRTLINGDIHPIVKETEVNERT